MILWTELLGTQAIIHNVKGVLENNYFVPMAKILLFISG